MSPQHWRRPGALCRIITVVLVLILIGSQSVAAQREHGKCNGEAPDSLWLAAGPVYLDCEVDRKASLRVNEPRINYAPSGADRRCRQATPRPTC
ncbi:MAG: hypothetical protein AB7L66_03090 [Gemmatimonadales bacterium]